MIHETDIRDALRAIGVEKGDLCLFHSSFKSLGPVEGGAEAVIKGFEGAIGEEGTLVAPTLCSKDFFNSYQTWHLDKPSDVGYLTEYFRTLPGALRSDQATHSVAARGPLAFELTHEHTAYGPHLCPFGTFAFADSSPWMKLYQRNAKIVFVGVTMKYNTMKHLVEATVTEKLLADIADPMKRAAQQAKLETFENRWDGVWLYYNGEQMQAELESRGMVRKTECGNATLLCVDAKATNDAAIEILLAEPEKWYRDERLQWIYDCKEL